MKVLLVSPPNNKPIRYEIPNEIDEEIGALPSLGLLYLASALERNSHHQIEIMDYRIKKYSLDELSQYIQNYKPDIIGITTSTFNLLDVLDVVDTAKSLSPDTYICLGGPHASIYPKETLHLNGVDFVVVGEGEYVFNDLLYALENKKSFEDIAGLGYKKDGREHISSKKVFVENLDQLPFPDRRKIDYKRCYSLLGSGKLMATIQSSRGCPYGCTCCDQQSGRKIRQRSVDSLLEEIDYLKSLGVDDLFFIDDLFTTNRQRVYDFCNTLIRKKIKIRLKISARVDSIDKYLLRMLKHAGCYRIHYGIESATQRILDTLNKKITLQQIEDAIRWTREVGITSFAYFMLGCPGETEEEVLRTIDYAIQLNVNYAHFSIATLYPGTDMYQMALHKQLIKSDIWQEFAQFPRQGFETPFWTENISRNRLIYLQELANKKFYLRSAFIAKELLRTKSIRKLIRKARTACKIALTN
jgi:radical SAM superfamily enzyme YgiQ (UPF0313 family)